MIFLYLLFKKNTVLIMTAAIRQCTTIPTTIIAILPPTSPTTFNGGFSFGNNPIMEIKLPIKHHFQ